MKIEVALQITQITANHIETIKQLKDRACYDLLFKLEQQRESVLSRKSTSVSQGVKRTSLTRVPHAMTAITGQLKGLLPLRVEVVESGHPSWPLFKYLLFSYHYLGFSGMVGENMKYLLYDRSNRPLACFLFGSASWNCTARDNFIGWDQESGPYQAAKGRYVGLTKGRSRDDRCHSLSLPVKAVYLYPLLPHLPEGEAL